ncbi:hypothetical protein BJV78DRAFT_1248569 [Lactifluus subvellereus]|nr:hypothetical protein BJV78DRAFT_1248569 [Lactifluus subvellereus]
MISLRVPQTFENALLRRCSPFAAFALPPNSPARFTTHTSASGRVSCRALGLGSVETHGGDVYQ